MDIFVGFSKNEFFTSADQAVSVTSIDFNQDDREPLAITFVESKAARDMTGWTVVAGFLGASGIPTGTAGGPAMAALTSALAYQSGSKKFTGLLDCNTDETAALIGSDAFKDTVFAVRATLPNADPTLIQRKQRLIACRVNAAAIEDDSAGGLSILRASAVGLLVGAGQVNSAAVIVPAIVRADLCRQLLPGDGSEAPRVKRWIVNENPDDASLNTLECELDAPAVGNVTIYAEIIANG